jgi:anthranilate 1,2-dioxygenase reductase component
MSEDWTQVWRAGLLTANREVGRGTRLLELELADDLPFPFEAGHVVVLRHGGHRHPYTVARAHPGRRALDLLLRVIPGGRLTPALETAAPGTGFELSGLHHGPVREGIADAAAQVVGLSTGSGIGPLWGFAEAALAAGWDRPIRLFAGFREAEDICLAPELDALQASYPSFSGQPTLTRPPAAWPGLRGRLGDSVPALLPDPRTCHFHLVGNGAMLAEFRAALAAVGVPPEQVTSEVFFNFKVEADPETVQAIVRIFIN